MATWYGEPYKLEEEFEIDPKWLVSHEAECDFAKLNSEVLTIIHEEKRFPTRDELVKIRNETLPAVTFTWDDLMKIDVPDCWGYVELSHDSTNFAISNEPKYNVEFTEPECPWNGITYEDFISHAQKTNQDDQPKSALASTSGLNKHTLNHRLI